MGAPDMVIEVSSPSSRTKDRIIKLNKYWQKGVREYWIVDPECQRISVYCFGYADGYSEYTFKDRVPLRIFDGKVVVNFAIISKHLIDRLGFDPKDPFAPDDDDEDDGDGPDEPTVA